MNLYEILATIAACCLLAEFWFRMRRANDRINTTLAAVSSTELAHGWHQPVPGDRNPPVMPSPRRSPNEQFVWRPVEPERSPRPVFDPPD